MLEHTRSDLERNLIRILSAFKEISFAYFFGSFAKGYGGKNSDIDIGLYFSPVNRPFDFEDDVSFSSEDNIWRAVERGTGRDTDLVVLNRSPATVCAAVLHEGFALFINDRELFLDFFLHATVQAEDFREFERDYFEIKQRSSSLNEIDKNRLIRLVDFCTAELADLHTVSGLSKQAYVRNATDRRNVERLIENLGMIEGFDTGILKSLASYSRLRNILAHEYVDIKYARITDFLEQADNRFSYLIDSVSIYLKNQ